MALRWYGVLEHLCGMPEVITYSAHYQHLARQKPWYVFLERAVEV